MLKKQEKQLEEQEMLQEVVKVEIKKKSTFW